MRQPITLWYLLAGAALLIAGMVAAMITPVLPFVSIRFSPIAAVVVAAASSDPWRLMIPSDRNDSTSAAFRRRIESRPQDYLQPLKDRYHGNDDSLQRAGVAATVALLLAGRTESDLPEYRAFFDEMKRDHSDTVRVWAK